MAQGMMHGLRWYGKKDIRYEEVPKPKILDESDVIVRITAMSICGSDLHYYANEIMDFRKGQTVGHEGMGIVEEVGRNVLKLRKGERVVIAFDIACGQCSHCLRSEFTGCEKTNKSEHMQKMYGHCFAGIYGFGDLAGGYGGCQAEFVRVPYADVNCLPVPDDIPDEKALYLSDVACTSYHAAIDLGQVRRGDKVAIWGAGPIGLLTAKWCDLQEAKEIYVIENVPERLEWLKDKLPRVCAINFDKVEVTKELARLCPEGVDVSIECAGFRYAKGALHTVERAVGLETDTAELLNECIMATRLYGRVVLISDYVGYANHVNLGGLMEKHLYLSGGQCPCQAVWDKVLPRIKDGSFDPTICVTHRGSLAEGVKVYEDMFYKRGGVIKTFLRPCVS
jgi:threonine dehydrogenase-like Zn-dependent dehydrogenase